MGRVQVDNGEFKFFAGVATDHRIFFQGQRLRADEDEFIVCIYLPQPDKEARESDLRLFCLTVNTQTKELASTALNKMPEYDASAVPLSTWTRPIPAEIDHTSKTNKSSWLEFLRKTHKPEMKVTTVVTASGSDSSANTSLLEKRLHEMRLHANRKLRQRHRPKTTRTS
jgi:hypothetical protein